MLKYYWGIYMYEQEINELLDIEKKVLKIYDKLIVNRLSNNTKEFNKEIDNLALITEYEDKLITEFVSKNKSKVDFFIKYNQIDFDPFTEEIIDTQKLYNNRLAISFVNKKANSLISNDIYEIFKYNFICVIYIIHSKVSFWITCIALIENMATYTSLI